MRPLSPHLELALVGVCACLPRMWRRLGPAYLAHCHLHRDPARTSLPHVFVNFNLEAQSQSLCTLLSKGPSRELTLASNPAHLRSSEAMASRILTPRLSSASKSFRALPRFQSRSFQSTTRNFQEAAPAVAVPVKRPVGAFRGG